MLAEIQKKNTITLNEISDNFEFNLNEFIINQERNLKASDEREHVNFDYQKIEISDSSESLMFEQYSNKFIIAVYGPKEIKQKSKIKNEGLNNINKECSIDVILRFNYDYNKEKIRYIQGLLINYVKSLIFTEEYPRCQIMIVINLISFTTESELLASLYNGIMFALSTSGIDMKLFGMNINDLALSICLDKDLIISLDANNSDNILYMDSSIPYDMETYDKYLSIAQEKIKELYGKYKTILIKKLLKR